MKIQFHRGDVVLVDLGMAAKSRPCVVVSTPQPDPQRTMAVVVPMTTEVRGGDCEVPFPKPPWLRQESVINVLGIAGVDHARIIRRIAPFPQKSLAQVMEAIADMLDL